MHGLEKEYGDRIVFTRVNILNPENRPLIEQYSFSTTPELYLVDGSGSILGFWDETVTEQDLRLAFDAALTQ